jgi:uncharacterized secreted protein with C-terminal beta-propeller domain
MAKRVLLALAAAALVAGPAATGAPEAAASHSVKHAKKVRLRAFNSCDRLVHYARRNVPRVLAPGGDPRRGPPPPSGGGPIQTQEGEGSAPAPQTGQPTSGTDSLTNVQEAGVDEPDVVKADGSHIFAVAGTKLHAVDASASTPRLLSSLELDGYGAQLLLRGDRLLVITERYTAEPVEGTTALPVAYGRSSTLLSEVDVSDPAAMRVVRTQEIDGTYVSARLKDASARIVLTTPPRALEQGQARLRRRVAGWMPSSVFVNRGSGRRGKRRSVASCRAVRRPVAFSGLDMLTVLTVDFSRGLPAVDADGLVTSGETVYASPTGLYVATQRYLPSPENPDERPPRISTAVHKFDVSDPDDTRYRASGQVPGYLLNQWSLSEHREVLRAASTSAPTWWGSSREESESFVTTLGERSGALVELGQVGGLGRGERIYAVRFIEDAGFVVTFRQIDPLYTLDLSDPDRPAVLGELKIRGYSAYLHPIDDGLLLGVGVDATEAGRTLGTQLSLFDVSDLRNPVRLHARGIGDSSSSEAEYDHHAFLWWAPAGLAVIPVNLYSEREGKQFAGAIGFRVDRAAGISEAGRASHGSGDAASYFAQVRRSLVVGGRLFTLSDLGVELNSLSTLEEEAWVPFPAPAGRPDGPPPPQPVPAR